MVKMNNYDALLDVAALHGRDAAKAAAAMIIDEFTDSDLEYRRIRIIAELLAEKKLNDEKAFLANMQEMEKEMDNIALHGDEKAFMADLAEKEKEMDNIALKGDHQTARLKHEARE
jgi:predicted deacetylase